MEPVNENNNSDIEPVQTRHEIRTSKLFYSSPITQEIEEGAVKTARTICCKLQITPEQDILLHKTATAFNNAASYCARVAWEGAITNKKTLHRKVYQETRKQFNLGAQLACSARDKAFNAVHSSRLRRGNLPIFRRNGSIRYDARSYSFKAADQVSLSTLKGRIICKLLLGDFQQQQLKDQSWTVGGAVLVKRGKNWFLHVVQTIETPSLRKERGELKVILDPTAIARTNKGVLTTKTTESVRERKFRHRQFLLNRNTRRARWRLRQLRQRELRFQQDVNHCVSKALVQRAIRERKALVIEVPIASQSQEMVKVPQRKRWHSWALYQLHQYITYKAKLAGIRVKTYNIQPLEPSAVTSDDFGRSQSTSSAAPRSMGEREHKLLLSGNNS